MALIKCPGCGREVSDKAAACPGCGFALSSVRRCEECGEILPSGAAVCPKCGLPTDTAEKPAVQQTPPPAASPAPPSTAPTAAAANAHSAPVASQDGVLVEGSSGVIMGRAIGGVVCLILVVVWSIVALTSAESSLEVVPVGIILDIAAIIVGIQLLRGSKGDHIKVTPNNVSGTAFNRGFDCSVSSVRSAYRNAKNTIILTVVSDDGKNKAYKLAKLPNHGEIYDILNSLIASGGLR